MIEYLLDYIRQLNASLQEIYYLVILVALIFTIRQVQSCTTSNNINLFDKIYTENKNIRENQIDARTQLRLIMLELAEASGRFNSELEQFLEKDETVAMDDEEPGFKEIEASESINGFISFMFHIYTPILNKVGSYLKILKYRLKNFPMYVDKGLDPMTTRGKIVCGNIFTDIYFNEKYSNLRETGYHYEYLGILVKYKMIPFKLVFDLITWPDDFWNESYYLRSIVRNHWLPDFWENAEYLHDLYMDARLKGTIINGKFDTKKLIYSKKRCKDHSNLSPDESMKICKDHSNKSKCQRRYDVEVKMCKVCKGHSKLSAYEHMSQAAYLGAKLYVANNSIKIINDIDYNDFKNAWKRSCYVH